MVTLVALFEIFNGLNFTIKGLIMVIRDWIAQKFQEIADKLPSMVHSDPSSFACGFNSGYKQALIDLEVFMDDRDNND